MRLLPDLVLTESGWKSGRAVVVEGGRIDAIEPAGRLWPGDLGLGGKALLPGTVNAHCHTFQSLLRGLGDDLDFMGWRDRVLYPFSQKLDRNGIKLGAAFAFAEMALHGATTCVDFFYLHDEGNENAEAVIEAAREVGIRLVLARAMYDWEGAPKRYRESVADATARVRELIARHRNDPTVAVQPAPHSPHGGVALRSRLNVMNAGLSSSYTRSTPRPPRNFPAPPESCRSPYFRTRIVGMRDSTTSTGLFRAVEPPRIIIADSPSNVGRPPVPPAFRSPWMKSLPVSACVPKAIVGIWSP
jgi:hypothetical protein